MSRQTTHSVLMIQPTRFAFNEQASQTNSFQHRGEEESEALQEKAELEFILFVDQLNEHGIDVYHYRDLPNSTTPDSIFPNNWFSTHREGFLCLYPMAVPNRRAERRADIIEDLMEMGYTLKDFTPYESDEQFLEGTGSLIFDHDNKVVYAAISPRTRKDLFEKVAAELGYRPVSFTAYGKDGEAIYHTNVVMCIAQEFIAIGLDTIDPADRERVEAELEKSGKAIIPLSNTQIYEHFAGNMLQVQNRLGESILVLSLKAYDSLNERQRDLFAERTDAFLPIAIPTIEYIGGGSVRCMMAELFFPEK
jgi:hypothetical protein